MFTQLQTCTQTRERTHKHPGTFVFSVGCGFSHHTRRDLEVLEQIPRKTDYPSTVHVDVILGYLERKVSTGLLERSRNNNTAQYISCAN